MGVLIRGLGLGSNRRRLRRMGGRQMARGDQGGRFGRPGKNGLAGDRRPQGLRRRQGISRSRPLARMVSRGRRLRGGRALPARSICRFAEFDRARRIGSRNLGGVRNLGLRIRGCFVPASRRWRGKARHVRSRWRIDIRDGSTVRCGRRRKGWCRIGSRRGRIGGSRGAIIRKLRGRFPDFLRRRRRRDGLGGRQGSRLIRTGNAGRRESRDRCILSLGEGRRTRRSRA